MKTLDNVAGESNPGYYTHIKKYENIPMTSVPGTEYRAWRPTNDDMKRHAIPFESHIGSRTVERPM